MNYSKVLSDIRDEKEMTSREFALACNISTGYASEIFTGKKIPSLIILEHICNRMNVDLATFFFKCINEQDGRKRIDTRKIAFELKETKKYLYGQ